MLNPPQQVHAQNANITVQVIVLADVVLVVIIVVVQDYAGEDVILSVILAPAVILVAQEHAVMDVQHVQIMLIRQQVQPGPGVQEMEA